MTSLALEDAGLEACPVGTKDELQRAKRELAEALAQIGELDARYRSMDLVVDNARLRGENAKLARALAETDADFASRSDDYHASLLRAAKDRDEARAAHAETTKRLGEANARLDAAVRAEREACAKVTEDRADRAYPPDEPWWEIRHALRGAATAIRARGGP